jgi:16S rRNA (adenine1518-N6/adenine1519-N6)-dimethyltransferase
MPPRGGRPARGRGSGSGRSQPGASDRLRPLKRFSQNFLVDKEMARRIADLSQVGPSDVVVEVGPGTGALTGYLLERAEHVHAVELDKKLFARLGVEYDTESRLSLHQGDILRYRVRDLAPGRRVVVVGNLPYAITSSLVLWLLEQHADIRRAVVLMQREVAERLTAPSGAREGGSLTLAVRYRAEAERVLDVPPRCFRPVPKVHSSLVAFRLREEPAVQTLDEAYLFRVIRAAFGKRRKTLLNALTAGLALPRPVVETAILGVGFDPRIRGERLSLEQFARLADELFMRRDPGEGPA